MDIIWLWAILWTVASLPADFGGNVLRRPEVESLYVKNL